MAGGDVVIRYEFLPTEKSIRESAQRVVSQLKKAGGKPITLASGKKLAGEFDKTVDSIINLLRATQQKTSLQTKLMSAMKFFGKRGQVMGEMPPAISPVGIGQGAGGENIGQAAAGVGGGGGMMGAITTMVGLLTVISISMILISAFFDAVGPIIKVVMKMFSAIILILLMPFLKRGLPLLFGMLTWLIKIAKGLSGFADKLLSRFEDLIGRALTGDPMAIIELLFGPVGMLSIFIFKKLTEFLASVDWNAVVASVIPLINAAFETVAALIDGLGIAVFGEEIWGKIKEGIAFIQQLFSPEGIWNSIKGAIEYIGTEIFGEGVWEDIKTELAKVGAMLDTTWGDIIDSLESIGEKLKPIVEFWENIIAPKSSTDGGDFPTKIKTFSTSILDSLGIDVPTPGDNDDGDEALDFISRPGMGIQKFSPSDTIIGTKGGMSGGINITNNLNVSAGVDKAEFRKILTELNRQQARELRTRTSYFGGAYA